MAKTQNDWPDQYQQWCRDYIRAAGKEVPSIADRIGYLGFGKFVWATKDLTVRGEIFC
jgi:hypothetical protein